jgi:ribosomal protein S18 acetylase RimI-like enzyme
MTTSIRKVQKDDLNQLKIVLDSIELFPSEMLEDMIADYFENQDTQDIWFTATHHDTPISIGYCAPEKLTEGTYNLYAIGVQSDFQGKGIGHTMMAYLEDQLKTLGHRILIVETSGLYEFQGTRKFYENLQYNKEAVIRDFWKEGDDKVVYWKKLN